MSIAYMKLAEKPGLDHPGYPNCGACGVEVDHDGDGWLCPSCGTAWPSDNVEAPPEDATLFEEWSGEELEGVEVPVHEAWRFSGREPADREGLIGRHLERRGGKWGDGR